MLPTAPLPCFYVNELLYVLFQILFHKKPPLFLSGGFRLTKLYTMNETLISSHSNPTPRYVADVVLGVVC